eukprot:3291394-Rhodomonas_salina.2
MRGAVLRQRLVRCAMRGTEIACGVSVQLPRGALGRARAPRVRQRLLDGTARLRPRHHALHEPASRRLRLPHAGVRQRWQRAAQRRRAPARLHRAYGREAVCDAPGLLGRRVWRRSGRCRLHCTSFRPGHQGAAQCHGSACAQAVLVVEIAAPVCTASEPSPPDVTVTAAELQAHNTAGNCWLVLGCGVYDVSAYTHSGGKKLVTQWCGKDATSSFSARHPMSYLRVLLTRGGKLVGKVRPLTAS